MPGLERLCLPLNRLLIFVGGVFLMAMIGLTCANIFIRLVWVPIRGTFELMGFGGALVTSFALGYTQLKRGHIAVDVLVDNFPALVKRGVTAVNSLLCAVFMALCAWQVWVKAETLRQTGEVTETLRIAYHPFIYGAAVGCAFVALVFIADLLKTFRTGRGGEG